MDIAEHLTRRWGARRRIGTRLVFAIMTAVAVAAPASAMGATKTVQMGPPPSGERSLKALRSEANAFFPTTVSVRVGDAVRFTPNGFHTVDLPPRGGRPLPFVVPTSVKANALDAGGRRFWFRGFDLLVVNSKLRTRRAAGTPNYDATGRLNSGLSTNAGYKPLTVRFKRRGSYTYFCNVHQGMRGSVRVLTRPRRVPTSADDRRTVTRQVRAAVKTAKALVRKRAARRTVSIGRPGAGGVERLAFKPAALTVTKGTTLTFAVSKGSRVGHTATTGPGSPREPGSYLGELVRSLRGPGFNPVAAYPSEPPTLGPANLTPRLHGNGFWNSGVMDGSASSEAPGDNRVRFAQSGRYRFHCLLHTSMSMTVTVK